MDETINTTLTYGVVKYFDDDYLADNSTVTPTTDDTTSDPWKFPDPTIKRVFNTVVEPQEPAWHAWRDQIYLLILTCIISGSLMNVLFVLSFRLSRRLERIGNKYLQALGYIELAETILVLPLLLHFINMEGDTYVDYCILLHMFAQITVYARSLFAVLTSLGWGFLRKRPKLMKHYLKTPAKVVIPTILFVCSLVVIVGIYTGLEFDFCKRENYGDIYFRSLTNFIFFAVNSLTALFLSLKTYRQIGRTKNYNMFVGAYKRRHFPVTEIILFNNALFIICWIPYVFTIYLLPDVNAFLYTSLVFLGLARAAVAPMMFLIFNRHFRRACAHTIVRILSLDFDCFCNPRNTIRLPGSEVRDISACELQDQSRETVRSALRFPRRLMVTRL